MKINDIVVHEDVMPGTGIAGYWKDSKLGKTVDAKLAAKNKLKLAKQNQKKWYSVVKKKLRDGVDMNNPSEYKKELYKFATGDGKLKFNIDFVNYLKKAKLDHRTVLEIMTKIIDERAKAKARLAKKADQQQSAAGGAA